ncbi:MAG TPA: hypothetical protein PLX15_05180 [Candidatus Woesearchaeota archaeon]|nr:hypothetical protein [Candidatus Woesearchaeota archaeon]
MEETIKWEILGEDYNDYIRGFLLQKTDDGKIHPFVENKLNSTLKSIETILGDHSFEDALLHMKFNPQKVERNNKTLMSEKLESSEFNLDWDSFYKSIIPSYINLVEKKDRQQFVESIKGSLVWEDYRLNGILDTNAHPFSYLDMTKSVENIKDVLSVYGIDDLSLIQSFKTIMANERKSITHFIEDITSDKNKKELAKLFVPWGNKNVNKEPFNQGVLHVLGYLPFNFERYFKDVPSSSEEIGDLVERLGNYTHSVIKQILPKIVESNTKEQTKNTFEYTLNQDSQDFNGVATITPGRNKDSYEIDIGIRFKYDGSNNLVLSTKDDEGVDYIIDVRAGLINSTPYFNIDSVRPCKK